MAAMPYEALVTPSFVRTMAAYNAEMNRRLYESANRLDPEERKRERGAFWGSIEATFAHLLWADRRWMSRLDGWAMPTESMNDAAYAPWDFDRLVDERHAVDAKISEWAGRVTAEWLSAEMSWALGDGREFTRPRSLVVTHFFNHQTHHRGQAHAMITAAGEATGDTDLILVI